MISQSRQKLQNEPITIFTSADFGTAPGKKLRVVHTTGTGVTRRTIIQMDLVGVDSFQFAQGALALNNLPAGQRQGFFMILPINFKLGKEYSMGFSGNCIAADAGNNDYQFLLAPIGSTDNLSTAIQGIGFNNDAGLVIHMATVINYTQMQANSQGIPLYGISTGAPSGITFTRGWWDSNLGTLFNRCMRGVSWLIDESSDAGLESTYLLTVNPVVYGDFN